MARLDVAVKLRPMLAEDIPEVWALEAEIYPEPWSEGVFREELSRDNRVYLVAEEAGTICGYGGLMLVEDDAHITTLAVSPAARQRGLGTRIMLNLVEAGLAAGARHLTLEVRVSNLPARDLYRRFGFAPVGLRKNYYASEDALVMWAIDVNVPEYRERLDRIREEQE